jgi:hypothetical protein
VNLCLWCSAHAHLETGELEGATPYFCQVARLRAENLVRPGEHSRKDLVCLTNKSACLRAFCESPFVSQLLRLQSTGFAEGHRLKERSRQLYRQEASSVRLRQYVANWWRWLWGGLEQLLCGIGGVRRYWVWVCTHLEIFARKACT